MQNILHFYTLTFSDQEEKLRKQSHLPLHQKKNPGINLPKEIKRPLFSTYKILMKDVKDVQTDKKNIPCSWIEELIL